MKKITQIAIFALILALPFILSAQPLPYDESIGGGNGNAPTGGGAPLGEGILLLFALASAYGTRKFVAARRKIMD